MAEENDKHEPNGSGLEAPPAKPATPGRETGSPAATQGLTRRDLVKRGAAGAFAVSMFGDVPINVIEPPSRDAKASGIRNSEGDRSLRRATWKATGIKIASAPTFFTKAERAVTQATRTPTCREDDRNSGVSQRTMTSTAPDRAIAALTISAPAISGTTGFEKPENA